MRVSHLSYQIFILFLFCCITIFATPATSAEIYIDPDVNYLTGAIGEEFQVELKVDNNTLGLRLFQVLIKFESSLLDTVASELGDLFETSGFSTYYNMKLVFDSETNDSLLKIEGLLLGASSVVDGPGTVALITFKTTSAGIANLEIVDHTLTDISNDPIASISFGTIAYIHTPPDSFNLLSPDVGETINKFPGESIELFWQSTNSIYPGENVLYDLDYSSDNSFPGSNTTTISGLSDTSYTLLADDLENGDVFWRVTAIGDIHSFEQSSDPDPSFFDFLFSTSEPDMFDLISPLTDKIENLTGDDSIFFDWEDATPGSPGDIIEYTFYLAETEIFPTTHLLEIDAGTNSQVSVASLSLPICKNLYWTVKAKNQLELSRWASSVHDITFIYRGDFNCSGEPNAVDISDIVALVDFMFTGGPPPILAEAGNLDCSLGAGFSIIDISDLVFIVDFAFTSGPPPICDL